MDIFLFSLLFVCFGIVYYILGHLAGRAVRTESDYFLANRSLGFWSLSGTLLATQLGGGSILGGAAHAYELGWPGLFYSVGMASGFIVLGLGLAGALRSFHISTTAELFEKEFKSTRLKKIASLLSILSLTGIFIGQVVASKSLMMLLGAHNDAIFLLFWGSLVTYTMYGGLPAVVATDLLQIVMILSVFGSLFISFWSSGVVDLSMLATRFSLSEAGSALMHDYWFVYIGMPLLFSLVEQDLAQRFFAARTRVVAMSGAFFAGLSILLFSAIPVSIGIAARLSGIAIPAGHNPLIVFVQAYAGDFLCALVMCALIAAIASTADSLLCAISSNVVQDFLHRQPTPQRMWSSRATTVIVGVIGIVGAYHFTDVLAVLTESYQLLVSSILVSVLVCFTSLPRVKRAAYFSVCGGFGAHVLLALSGIQLGVPRALVALAVSLMGYLLGMIGAATRNNVSQRS